MLRVTGVFNNAPSAPYYNSLYFGGTTEGEAQAAANAAAAFWGVMDNALRTGMTFSTGSEVELVDAATGQVTDVFPVTPANVSFTGTLEPLPPANQGLIRMLTGFFVNGRRLRGRIFIPGVTEGMTADGKVTSGTQTLFQDAANLLRTDGTPAGGLQVYSVTHRVSAPVSAATPWDQFAIQRSRRD